MINVRRALVALRIGTVFFSGLMLLAGCDSGGGGAAPANANNPAVDSDADKASREARENYEKEQAALKKKGAR